MIYSFQASRARCWLATVLAAGFLLGCGGGGGGGGEAVVADGSGSISAGGGGSSPGGGGSSRDPAPIQTVQIVDSFNRVLAPGEAGVGPGDSGADGTAGDGAGIPGGTVQITDAEGKTVSAVTDSQGYYRAKITGFVPPFVAKVTRTDGRVLHSLNVKPLKVNGFITLNLSGLTDKIASDVARAGGRASASELTPQIVAANPGAVTASINSLKGQLGPVITAAGVDVATFDPLSVPFRADHTGYDFVLDNTRVTVNPDGGTQVAVAPTFGVPALTGTWSASFRLVDLANQLDETFTGPDVPGSAVPKDAATAAFFCQSGIGEVVNVEGGSLTCNGNVMTITTPDEPPITFTSTPVSYEGCGSCGVGSRVVIVESIVGTQAGTNGFRYTLTRTFVRRS